MERIKVTELDHIVLNVGDIDRSLKFYIEVLGLQPERLDEFKAGNLNHFCMVVAQQDFSGIVGYLGQYGIPVREGPVSRWGARGRATSVYFLDPDGNEVEIRCY